MDGIALLSAVRERNLIPFILIADSGTDGREDDAIAAGADFCFTRIPDTARQFPVLPGGSGSRSDAGKKKPN